MRERWMSAGATPARARSARPSSSISAKGGLIAGQSARASRGRPVRTKSNASGAARSPYADIAPAPNGIRMRGTLRIFATCQQWTGPAPPKAKSGYCRRSRPRSIPWMRAAAAMFSFHAVDPPRRAGHVETEPACDVLPDDAMGGLAVEAHASAQEELGVEVAEQEVRVGHRRVPAAEGVAGGAGVGARA